ncbi:hypothetical protein [Undibacterium sp.]|jgi:hypothetical protein|uniref:hypothetical protein n=1 Tax=Undibacterium sp. TaxID=1914977 RepID=UPI002B96E017|nr:hypothetical protein [Undibacterium sp.]HTD03615.1 hypothetical protein [Undibacterium sp.]
MSDKLELEPAKEKMPRFGRLLVVCFGVIIICGVLVWVNESYLSDCCSFDFLDRITGYHGK